MKYAIIDQRERKKLSERLRLKLTSSASAFTKLCSKLIKQLITPFRITITGALTKYTELQAGKLKEKMKHKVIEPTV